MKNEEGIDYNAPFFISRVKIMKDILDSKPGERDFHGSHELLRRVVTKNKRKCVEDGFVGIYKLQRQTLESLYKFADEKLSVHGYGYYYYTNKNPLLHEHMFKETLLNGFSSKLKKLIENINIVIKKDKYNSEDTSFKKDFGTYFKDNNEFKLF